ncbi:MAG: hypothetical protein OXH16_11325 [Gemmatimonadetes bacterium]|nr:hypothetical protein [Gemmatimonadota bacterium]
MSDKLSLPVSSYSQLTKLIVGYSHGSENMSLDDLANLVGMGKSRISGNHKFLAEIGLIAGGQKKSATPLGKNLGRALEHNQEDDTRSFWQKTIQGNVEMSKLITTISIQRGMPTENLISHILYVSGQRNSKSTRAGARTISDILVFSGLLEDQDGQLKVAEPIDKENEAPEPPDNSSEAVTDETDDKEEPLDEEQTTAQLNIPTIAINIQLQIPETENADVYENLFKALRKHLLNPDE